jgi:CHAT domain-containing protein
MFWRRKKEPQLTLMESLGEFVNALSLVEARNVLERSPQLLTDQAESILADNASRLRSTGNSEAADALQRYISILRTSRAAGIERAFDEAAAAEPVAPAELTPLLTEASDAEQQFETTGDLQALDRAVDAWSLVLEHPLLSRADPRVQFRAAAEAGAVRMRRHSVRGRGDDIDAALQLWNRVADVPSADSSDLARLYTNMGGALVARHRIGGASADLDRAIELIEKAEKLGDDAVIASGLAGALHARYKLAGAFQDLERAVDLARTAVQRAPPDSEDLPAYLSNLAALLSARFALRTDVIDIEHAVQAATDAVTRTAPTSPQLPGRRHTLGQILTNRYEATGALEDLERAVLVLDEVTNATDDASPQLAARMHDLGAALLAVHKRRKRESDIRTACEMLNYAVERTPPDSREFHVRCATLAVALTVAGAEMQDAVSLDAAVVTIEGVIASEDGRAAPVPAHLTTLGNALQSRYQLTKDPTDLNAAIDAFRRAAATESDSRNSASYLSNLSTALRLRYDSRRDAADLNSARESFRAACAAAARTNPTTHLVAARNWGIWASERQSWEEAAEAFDEALQAAATLYAPQMRRAHKETWLHDFADLPAVAAYAFARQGDLVRAVTTLERGRAQFLSEALDRTTIDLGTLSALGQDVIAERYQRALENLNDLQRRELDPAAAEHSQHLAALLRAAHADIDELLASIRAIEGFDQFGGVTGFDVVREAAADGVVTYIAGTECGGIALVVTPDGQVTPVWLEQLTDAELRARLSAYGRAYESREADPSASMAALDDLTRWSWDAVMAPVIDAVPEPKRAIMITMGYLGLVPLHAAWTPDSSTVTKRRYALDDLQLSVAPNARAVVEARKRAQRLEDNSVLVVADPGERLGVLPHADAEARMVAAAFPQSTILSRDVSRLTVLEQIAAWSVIHFSCHAVGNVANPLASALVLQDGVLTMRDFLEKRLNGTRLVALSACETALTGTALPDESVGLPVGLLQAGAAAVVGSMWPVPEVSTLMLMARFYEFWKRDGLEPAEALRRAQCWVRDATNMEKRTRFPDVLALSGSNVPEAAREFWEGARIHAQPYHWAAFSYIGA